MKSFRRTALFFIIILVLKCSRTAAATTNESSSYIRFAADLFANMVAGKSSQNVIYSPASIQTSLSLAFMGAEGETANEIRRVLHLGEEDRMQIARKVAEFLKAENNTNNLADDQPSLKMANRLYVSDKLRVSEEFSGIAREYFQGQAQAVNFQDSETAVATINSWVTQQTENKIKDILKPDAFDSDTNALLINAIYFKAEWLSPFSQASTSLETFYGAASVTQSAEIMYNEDYYGYAELSELAASILEMPYKNSNISMLIILPNEIEGLESLELKLKDADLNDIMEKILIRKVQAYIPKFRIEFDVNLQEPLEKMGLKTTFSPTANFTSLFATPEVQSSFGFKHKAFLDINEAGSEAAAATFAQLTVLSSAFDEPIFRADHPFVFAILSNSAVYFAGHVVTV